MRKEALALTGILLLVIAVSGCVTQDQPDDGPQVIEIGFMKGIKYTYDMAYADTNTTAVTELYVTDEMPPYWEGIVTMKGELEADNETHKIAHIARFRISKENFWIGMTRRLSLQDAVKTDHLYNDFIMNDISKPFHLLFFGRAYGMNVTGLIRTGKSTFIDNGWPYNMERGDPVAVDDFLAYKVDTIDYPTRHEFYISLGEPYLLIYSNQDGLIMNLRSIELAQFRTDAWDEYALFLEYTTFNRSGCSDYLSEAEAEELLGSDVTLSSSTEGNLELDPRANLVCVYDAEEEHIVVMLDRFQSATDSVDYFKSFVGALNSTSPDGGITWEETNEFGMKSVSYTGGLTNDIRFVSDIDPTFMVTVASQRESVTRAVAEKVESRILLKN